MEARKTLLLLAMVAAGSAFAQTKLDMELNHLVVNQQVSARRAMSRGQEPQEDMTFVSTIAMLNDDAELPVAELENLGVKIGSRYGSFVLLNIPVCQLQTVSEMDEFRTIEMNQKLPVTSQQSRISMNVDKMQDETTAKAEQLPHTYTGAGVVVGVVDCGFDFNHNNFRKPDGTTRIKEAIVYHDYIASEYSITDAEGKPVDIKDVRNICTSPQDIDTLTTDTRLISHGSHTAGIAAGSYSGAYVDKDGKTVYTNQQGVAPEADLILAGVGGSGHIATSICIDALTSIRNKAEDLKEPYVINLSYGSSGDWNDGKMVASLFYDEFTDKGSKPGVIVCTSSSNEGADKWTFRYTLDKSNNHTLRVLFDAQKVPGDETTKVIYDYVKTYSDDTTAYAIGLEFWGVKDEAFVCFDSTTYTAGSLLDNGIISYERYANHDNRYAAMMSPNPQKLISFSSTLFPVLVFRSLQDCSIRGGFIERQISPQKLNYLTLYKIEGSVISALGSPDYSISSIACTNSVLSVGAWNQGNTFNNWYGDQLHSTLVTNPTGDIADFSSYCVADDNGVQRPDFCAPGVCVKSSFNSYDVTSWARDTISNAVCGIATENYLKGHTSVLAVESGTSMACPNATGVMALWLQADSTLCVNDVRQIVKETAMNDSLTFTSKARFGSGKLDALKGLQWILKNRPAAIRDINAAERLTSDDVVRKAFVNGRLIILKNGKQYDVNGVRIK